MDDNIWLMHGGYGYRIFLEAAWLASLVMWGVAWYYSIRWFHRANGSAPLARTIVVLCTVQIGLTGIALVLIPFLADSRGMPRDLLGLILPAVQIVSAYTVLKGGQWMYEHKEGGER